MADHKPTSVSSESLLHATKLPNRFAIPSSKCCCPMFPVFNFASETHACANPLISHLRVSLSIHSWPVYLTRNCYLGEDTHCATIRWCKFPSFTLFFLLRAMEEERVYTFATQIAAIHPDFRTHVLSECASVVVITFHPGPTAETIKFRPCHSLSNLHRWVYCSKHISAITEAEWHLNIAAHARPSP